MNELLSLVEKSFLTTFLTQEEIHRAIKSNLIQLKIFNRNTRMFHAEESLEHATFILEGQAEATLHNINGDVLYQHFYLKNEIIEPNLLFGPNPIISVPIYASKKTYLAVVDKAIAFQFIIHHPKACEQFLTQINTQYSMLNRHLFLDHSLSIREKLFFYFDKERIEQQNDCILLPFTKKDLANKLMIQRSSLHRELKNMVEDKLITVIGKEIILHFEPLH
ncbi:Crp/Fnr family transcriptional regulator [Lacticigenium naphthae]|uniref:Crp/Fnr family transcriptional regulator n=1 Tax=Lacticigenium naphthae TaxID=515351 RepID=UPI0004119234|nr:Crp/Fnr family transcriptional regulator [Lacticigenium naphthae]